MKKTLARAIRVLLGFLILASAAMCKFWLPGAMFYIVHHIDAVSGGTVGAGVSITVCWLSAAVILPLFAILVMAFAFPRAIENDALFSTRTAKLLKVIGIILIVDCAFFCAMLTVLLFMEEWLLSAALIFVGVLGITVGCMLLVLSKYVRHAAALKEEADCTL